MMSTSDSRMHACAWDAASARPARCRAHVHPLNTVSRVALMGRPTFRIVPTARRLAALASSSVHQRFLFPSAPAR